MNAPSSNPLAGAMRELFLDAARPDTDHILGHMACLRDSRARWGGRACVCEDLEARLAGYAASLRCTLVSWSLFGLGFPDLGVPAAAAPAFLLATDLPRGLEQFRALVDALPLDLGGPAHA